jgi:pilus assembly protein CpaD
MTARTSQSFSRSLRTAGALVGVAVALGACVHDNNRQMVDAVPGDYRLRHPIAVEEANQSIVVFVGRGRGGLTAEQRADVVGVAQSWMHAGTGVINVDVPVDTPNARAAADSAREIQATLGVAGVPSRAVALRPYHPESSKHLAAIRVSYPRMKAEAGPCGLWPEDLGPSIKNPNYYDNKDYYNFGCAYQRNMAAMVANPSDLVQPRPETPAYTERRREGFEKYRQGQTTTTTYPETDRAKLSDAGK